MSTLPASSPVRAHALRRTAGRMPTRRPHAGLESLEARIVLAGYAPEEVALLELVNAARANPQAEAARLGIDLEAGLSAEEIALIGAVEPLAFSDALLAASRGHSRDMGERGFLDFINPDGQNAQDRADAAGFDGNVRENLAGGFAEPAEVYTGWMGDPVFRRNILSLESVFRPAFRPTEFGAGRFLPPANSGADFDAYWTALFGIRDVSPTLSGPGLPPTYLLGVAFADANADGRYDLGEGLGGVEVRIVDPASPATALHVLTTEPTGYYQVELADGDYLVTFVDPVTGNELTRQVTVDGANVREAVTGEELNGRTQPESPTGRVARLGANYDLDERLVIASRAGDGAPFFYQQAVGGGWAGRDISTLIAGETLISEFTTFTDPKDGRSYAAVASSEGLLLFTNNGGTWTKRNLTQELGADAVNITSELTAFVDRQNNAYIAGLDARNDLVLYQQTRQVDNANNFQWSFRNVAEEDLRANGRSMPRYTGELISFVTSWNALNIAGLDTNGDIQTVWIADSLSAWTTSNLSAITNAPALEGGLTAYLTSWNGINIGGIDATGDLVVTWWVPSFGGDWRQSNLTNLFSGPSLQGATVSSYVTSWGGLNVAGLSADGTALEVYWWAPGLNDWRVTRLSSFVPGGPIPAGPITGATSDAGRTSLVGATAEGDVIRYFWQPGDPWRAENISDLFVV